MPPELVNSVAPKTHHVRKNSPPKSDYPRRPASPPLTISLLAPPKRFGPRNRSVLTGKLEQEYVFITRGTQIPAFESARLTVNYPAANTSPLLLTATPLGDAKPRATRHRIPPTKASGQNHTWATKH
jgi:hypothetical protein